jgi:hypothetical protein
MVQAAACHSRKGLHAEVGILHVQNMLNSEKSVTSTACITVLGMA